MHEGPSTSRGRHWRWLALLFLIPTLAIGAALRPGGEGAGVDLFTEDLVESDADGGADGRSVTPVEDAVPGDADAQAQRGTASVAADSQTTGATSTADDGADGGGDADPNATSSSASGVDTAGADNESFAPPAIALTDGAGDGDAPLTPSTNTTTTIGGSPALASVATTPPTQAEQVSTTPTAAQSAEDLWCEVEVRADDGIIRWNDLDRTAVIRRNDDWFHTPVEAAVAVQIPERVETADVYLLRVWGGGGSEDVICSYVAGATTVSTPSSTTSTTTTATTTTTTTTTLPEAVAFVELPSPIGVPGGPVQMGFNVDLWGQDRTDYWNDLEAVPGNGRLIAHEFKTFTKDLNMSVYEWHMQQNRDLLLTWNGTTASAITSGSHDAWIRDHAQQLKTLPGTVMLRFWHEPDVSYKASWIEGDPQNYIDAWMHVRRIFVEEGATSNIEWVWCPTAWNWEQQGARFYPGDANVDWICADGYSGMNLDNPLDPIANEFSAFQAWANQHPSKPIIIAEFGATARNPGDRAAWVQQIPSWVNASPNIRAVVYFDYDMRATQPWDWRLRTEADAWQAMMSVLSSAPFG